MSEQKKIGNLGENLASEYMKSKGYETIAKNYRTPHGEIDLICENDERLVFVEVKTRRNLSCGRPSAAVGSVKQQRFISAAEKYLSENKTDKRIRLDVIEVYLNGNNEYKTVHLENAFYKKGEY